MHVVPGLGRSFGGPSYSVPSLSAAQREAGASVRLFAVESRGDEPLGFVDADFGRHDYAGVPLIRKLRTSKSLQTLLSATVPRAALVHVHGIWLMPNVQAGRTARRYGRPLVVSPRGMLAADALRISRFQKRAFWKLLQEQAYAGAAVWHATCEAEAEEIRAFGIHAPIAVIANGIDIPPAPLHHSKRDAGGLTKTALFLGRIHPIKGLTSLIKAWARVGSKFPDWQLRIVGPDESGHAAELRNLAIQLGAKTVLIEPAVFGAQKSEVLANATLFVLPTLHENFGLAVAEALAASLPAIVTKGAPWPGLQKEQCGWWIDQGVQSLAEALQTALQTSPAELRIMGERGRVWMARDFCWGRIARDMLRVYDWIDHGGAPPSTVRLN